MYIGILENKGIEVEESEALEYARNEIIAGKGNAELIDWLCYYADVQIQQDFLGWYYSGNWVHEN